ESPHEIQADQMEILPPRDRLYTSSSGIPFVTEDDLSNPALFSNTSGIFLPLPPVLFRPEPFFEKLEEFIRTQLQETPNGRIYLGLNNIGHLPFTWRFHEEERVRFFVDYGLYMANRFAIRMVKDLVPRLDFYYPWIEEPSSVQNELPHPQSLSRTCSAAPYGEFLPPLFMGRACVHRSLPNSGSCVSCSMPMILRQGKRKFLLRSVKVGGSCLNLLFQIP
ncbi:MAG: hypothetical protein N2442_05045, partial [Spirochaetes bacterium]|nr:hypothetical protein [Spirochaetota bacterium]